MSTTPRSPTRPAFTIIEVLIVIIIIVILAGLLLPAVQNALRQAKVTACRVEIANLGVALDQYQTDFATYPPSCVWWRRVSGSGPWPNGWDTGEWRWYTTDPGDGMKMCGAECLVYFLGGGPLYAGFHTGTKTYGPYMPVQGGDLADVNQNGFREIQDAFRSGSVYLYFKADRSRPGTEYTAADNAEMRDQGGINPNGTPIPPGPGQPVRDPSNVYYRPTAHQLICAGIDERYARQATLSEPEPSRDDITNFSSR